MNITQEQYEDWLFWEALLYDDEWYEGQLDMIEDQEQDIRED